MESCDKHDHCHQATLLPHGDPTGLRATSDPSNLVQHCREQLKKIEACRASELDRFSDCYPEVLDQINAHFDAKRVAIEDWQRECKAIYRANGCEALPGGSSVKTRVAFQAIVRS